MTTRSMGCGTENQQSQDPSLAYRSFSSLFGPRDEAPSLAHAVEHPDAE
jgi:hypothetical protein